jgi:hypothetical protein
MLTEKKYTLAVSLPSLPHLLESTHEFATSPRSLHAH